MLTITVFVSTGRIHVLGRFFKEWGSDEFEHIVSMVNSADGNMTVEHGESFLEKITKGKNKLASTDKENITTGKPQITSDSPREKTFSMIKQHLSNLEVNFISFKEDTNTQIRQLNETIQKKDEEITLLKNEIMSLKSTNKDKQQAISDLSTKQLCLEEQIDKITTEHVKQTKLINTINKKQNNQMAEKVIPKPPPSNRIDESCNEERCTYTIPTSNNFDVLDNKEAINPPSTIESNPEDLKKNKPEPKPTTQQNNDNMTNNHKPIETVILCDSNGRFLNPTLLCPDSPTQYIRCPTLTDANNLIKNSNFTHAKCFILHCGTNDLEKVKSVSNLAQLAENVVKTITGKYPHARIIVSGLLPRKDSLNENVLPFNSKLKETLANVPNITFVNHKNINWEDLKDKKHLTQGGVKYFAKNLKAAFYNTTPRNDKRKPSQTSERYAKHQRLFPRKMYYKPTTNPYTPRHKLPPSTTYEFPPKFPVNPLARQNPYPTPYPIPSNHKPSPLFPNQASSHMVDLIKELYRCLN